MIDCVYATRAFRLHPSRLETAPPTAPADERGADVEKHSFAPADHGLGGIGCTSVMR